MAEHEHRQLTRDSLFLMADLRLAEDSVARKVRVRNLSAGGMMAEGALGAVRGTHAAVHIRHIGWVEGVIAWIQGDRCGIAFTEDIDPMIARAPRTVGERTPRFVKPPLAFGAVRARKV